MTVLVPKLLVYYGRNWGLHTESVTKLKLKTRTLTHDSNPRETWPHPLILSSLESYVGLCVTACMITVKTFRGPRWPYCYIQSPNFISTPKLELQWALESGLDQCIGDFLLSFTRDNQKQSKTKEVGGASPEMFGSYPKLLVLRSWNEMLASPTVCGFGR